VWEERSQEDGVPAAAKGRKAADLSSCEWLFSMVSDPGASRVTVEYDTLTSIDCANLVCQMVFHNHTRNLGRSMDVPPSRIHREGRNLSDSVLKRPPVRVLQASLDTTRTLCHFHKRKTYHPLAHKHHTVLANSGSAPSHHRFLARNDSAGTAMACDSPWRKVYIRQNN
jgi:hypothetical protein